METGGKWRRLKARPSASGGAFSAPGPGDALCPRAGFWAPSWKPRPRSCQQGLKPKRFWRVHTCWRSSHTRVRWCLRRAPLPAGPGWYFSLCVTPAGLISPMASHSFKNLLGHLRVAELQLLMNNNDYKPQPGPNTADGCTHNYNPHL